MTQAIYNHIGEPHDFCPMEKSKEKEIFSAMLRHKGNV